jgi:hypothetical protein
MNNGNIKTVSDLYPSPWLHAGDLAKPVAVRIAGVELQEFHLPDGTDHLALVVSFEKAKRRLILNKTQARALMAICGTEVFSEWVGASVQLAPAMASNHKGTIAVLAAATVATKEEA